MRRTVIRNAMIVSMDAKIGDFHDADLLIDGEKIAEVRPNIGPVDAQEIDGRGMIVIPGFIDTHRHTWQCMLRNAAADWTLAQYFGGVRGVMGELYTPDDMYLANYVGALEALDAGITTLYDWSHNNNTPDHADMAVKGLRDAGLRAVYGYGNANREWFPVSDLPSNFDDVARVRRTHFNGDDGLMTMAFAARGPQFATLDVTEDDFRKARELGLRITLHAGDGLWGLNHPVDQLHSRGLLRDDTTYVHCCTLSDSEFKLIADTGGTASLSAEVELNMGHGNPATLGLLKHGCRPSISIDVCCSVGGDMFAQMRILMAGTRGFLNEEALARHALVDPLPITTRDILDFATVQGARACGLEGRTGSLTPGKQADIVMLDTYALNMFPINNPIGAVVEDAHVGNIDTVFVAGRIMKRHGKLVHADVRGLRGRMERSADALFERAGVPRDGTWLPKPYVRGTDAE
ncbi:amidohydrolase family protein [Acidisphaera rubrifaciens]|uniref:5-methylthioadenosine/S-adenosylhomocysteine deaminase n=1 Tax=Acidisphaera rubrifaciens HS-AP3 TaxID=1231350 RepID=A0A0D6P9L6_9PROT|nr:amidohydrolase family protein [Acidisphaera rubrifaciens]GAN78455.1 5-methylthioadenosine/S-adenosylhomocysteine deaminase [Acidisphaera rubrifaciens HS-AP3]